jgi:hypothetical protein
MSRRNDIEIIPPFRAGRPAQRADQPSPWGAVTPAETDGVFSSALTRWRANRQARTWEAMATSMKAAKEYYDSRTQAIESYIKSQEAAYRAARLPETAAADAARARAEQHAALRTIEHRQELAELNRMTELARVEAALAEAHQALRVQYELGYGVIFNRRTADLLDAELAVAERRAVQRQHLKELENAKPARSGEGNDGMIDDALYEMRAHLHSGGMDTSRIDDIIEWRKLNR